MRVCASPHCDDPALKHRTVCGYHKTNGRDARRKTARTGEQTAYLIDAARSGGCVTDWPWSFTNNRPAVTGGYASRLACELVNGPPPTPEHIACHRPLCKPNCVNGAHIRWDSPSENTADIARRWVEIGRLDERGATHADIADITGLTTSEVKRVLSR